MFERACIYISLSLLQSPLERVGGSDRHAEPIYSGG